MTDVSAPREFWERKILSWEKFRYSHWLAFYPLSWSVRSRLRTAIRILRKRGSSDWSILELGCGSGLLAAKLANSCRAYQGMDIAENAIARARERVPHFQFSAGDVLTQEMQMADLTVFLGLTDWLDERGLNALFAKIKSPRILFSYTHVSPWNPYRLYRRLMDKPSSSGVLQARTYEQKQIREMLATHGFSMECLTRPYLLNPGVLVWAAKTK